MHVYQKRLFINLKWSWFCWKLSLTTNIPKLEEILSIGIFWIALSSDCWYGIQYMKYELVNFNEISFRSRNAVHQNSIISMIIGHSETSNKTLASKIRSPFLSPEWNLFPNWTFISYSTRVFLVPLFWNYHNISCTFWGKYRFYSASNHSHTLSVHSVHRVRRNDSFLERRKKCRDNSKRGTQDTRVTHSWIFKNHPKIVKNIINVALNTGNLH